jgi:hypothetical protein
MNNIVPGAEVIEAAEEMVNSCCLCMFSVDDRIARCNSCSRFFCCRLAYEDRGACIEFFCYSQQNPLPPYDDLRSSFICPFCWNHSEEGLYPVSSHCSICLWCILSHDAHAQHFVRSLPRFYLCPNEELPPRLVVVVYYLAEFWPVTSHFVRLITGAWKTEGWAVSISVGLVASH